jgi:hypothetical protein
VPASQAFIDDNRSDITESTRNQDVQFLSLFEESEKGKRDEKTSHKKRPRPAQAPIMRITSAVKSASRRRLSALKLDS